jgi:hypothetical protein
MKPNRIEFKIGETRFRQPIKLIVEERDNVEEWSIERGMGNQQDNVEKVHHLTRDMILKMAQAVQLTSEKFLFK